MKSSLLTTKQVAEELNVSMRTIERLLASREIPHVRIGHSVRYDLSEILTHAKEKAVGETA